MKFPKFLALCIVVGLFVVFGASSCSQSIDFHDEKTRCIARTHHRFLGVEYRDKEYVWDKNPCEYPFNIDDDHGPWGRSWGRP